MCWFLGQMSKYMVNGANGCWGRKTHVRGRRPLCKAGQGCRGRTPTAGDGFLHPGRKHRGHIIIWNDYLANEP